MSIAYVYTQDACTHLSMHVYTMSIHLCICISIHICIICTCIHTCIHTHLYTFLYTWPHEWLCTCPTAQVCISVTHVYITHEYTHVHANVHADLCTNTCINHFFCVVIFVQSIFFVYRLTSWRTYPARKTHDQRAKGPRSSMCTTRFQEPGSVMSTIKMARLRFPHRSNRGIAAGQSPSTSTSSTSC